MPTVEKTEARKPVEFLRAAPVSAAPVGVDKENKIIRGVVLAQTGPFFSGRGEFDQDSIKGIAKLVNASPQGLKIGYGHPDPNHPGAPEELDGFLGRAKNAVVDGDKTRADVHLDPTALLTPPGGGTSRGELMMARAESDPTSFGMSLQLSVDKKYRMDNHNKPKRNDAGEVLPPIWTPLELLGADCVGKGDATPGGLLAAADDALVFAAAVLDKSFAGFDRATIGAFFNFYMASRFVSPWEPELEVEDPSDVEDMAAPTSESLAADDEALRLRWANQKRKAGAA